MRESETTTIESVKSYWNARPCNIRHSPKPLGSKEYFDEVERRKYFVEPHIPAFAEFDAWKGKRVLEVGCGIGTDTINFARAGATVTAVDLSNTSLKLANQRAEVFGFKDQISFFQGNVENLLSCIPIQPFDLVYSFGVLHHTPNPEKAIEQIKPFMSPSSEFRLMVYAKNSWKNFMIEAGMDQPEAQRGCPIVHTYDFQEVRELLQGFQISDIRQTHIFPYVIDKYVQYEYEIVPWFASMPKSMFTTLEKHLGWHLLIKARLA